MRKRHDRQYAAVSGVGLYVDKTACRRPISSLYRAMHYSAKRGLAIACRLSVRLSVCLSLTLVDHDHRLKILENCTNN